jgi:hypothetical protein
MTNVWLPGLLEGEGEGLVIGEILFDIGEIGGEFESDVD